MVTDRKLKSALLEHLEVTPQRLSQRVKKMKQDHGPMSTENATYVIAHQEGIDLTRYLPAETVDRIRGLVPGSHSRGQPKSNGSARSRIPKQVLVSIGTDLPKVDALLSTTIASDAARMAELYPKYYVLENSVRFVIKRILEYKYGPSWWQTQVAEPVRKKVSDRKLKEKTQPWHGKRGQHEIFYSDFGDLKRIVQKNWSDFKDLFPSQPWILQKLDELETPRNILAHHNPVGKRDQQRIDLYYQDWIALIRDRKQLIP